MRNNISFRARSSFGRRRTNLHGIILIRGREPIPCLVRNITEEGALLELDRPELLPSYFSIRIDSDRFSADCEIRRKTVHGAAVFFTRVTVGRGGVDSRLAHHDQRPSRAAA